MRPDEIVELIASDESDNNVAKTLKREYKKNPELININFVFDRSIFHLLTMHGREKAIERLLTLPYLKPAALKPDRFGKTILHYAVNSENHVVLIKTLINNLPEILNIPCNVGNTPLHEAVKNNQIVAITLLRSSRLIRIDLTNQQNQTVFDLASDKQNLILALINEELSKTKKHFLYHKTEQKVATDELTANFPSLFKSTFHQDSVAFLEAQHDMANVLQHLQNTEIDALFINEKFSLPKDNVAINYLMNELSFLAFQREGFFSNENYLIFKNFLCAILGNKLINNNKISLVPDFAAINPTRIEQLEIVWNFVTYPNFLDIDHQLDLVSLSQKTAWLLTTMPVKDVLIAMRLLYKNFSHSQKLVANLIVFLIIQHNMDDIHQDAFTDLQVKLFLKCNADAISGINTQYFNINAYIEGIIQNDVKLKAEPLQRNLKLLSRWIKQNKPANSKNTFDDLVNLALSKKGHERKSDISLIVAEMQSLILNFYKNVPLTEFKDCAWSKEKSASKSPHIVAQISIINQLSNYLLNKILTQPKENIKNSLCVLLELAESLCSTNKNQFIDLNNLMLVSSILNSADITRLKDFFALLSPKDLLVLEQINNITTSNMNFRWLRYIYREFKNCLPFLGLFLTDVTFAIDGNRDSANRAEACGAISSNLIKLRQIIKIDRPLHTDIAEFLASYAPVSEERLSEMSLQIQPRQTDKRNSASLDANLLFTESKKMVEKNKEPNKVITTPSL